jgi:hypothetical protein
MSSIALAEFERTRANFCPDLTGGQFLWRICNEGAALPAHKIQGTLYHLPAMCLGDPENKVAGHQRKERLGWQNKKYLFVLPEVSGIDVSMKQALSSQSRGGAFLRKELESLGFDL